MFIFILLWLSRIWVSNCLTFWCFTTVLTWVSLSSGHGHRYRSLCQWRHFSSSILLLAVLRWKSLVSSVCCLYGRKLITNHLCWRFSVRWRRLTIAGLVPWWGNVECSSDFRNRLLTRTITIWYLQREFVPTVFRMVKVLRLDAAERLLLGFRLLSCGVSQVIIGFLRIKINWLGQIRQFCV